MPKATMLSSVRSPCRGWTGSDSASGASSRRAACAAASTASALDESAMAGSSRCATSNPRRMSHCRSRSSPGCSKSASVRETEGCKGAQPGKRRIAQEAGVDQRAAGYEFEEPQVPHGVPGVRDPLQGLPVEGGQDHGPPKHRRLAAPEANSETASFWASSSSSPKTALSTFRTRLRPSAEVSRKFLSWLLPSSTASASSPKKRSANAEACRSSIIGRTIAMASTVGSETADSLVLPGFCNGFLQKRGTTMRLAPHYRPVGVLSNVPCGVPGSRG